MRASAVLRVQDSCGEYLRCEAAIQSIRPRSAAFRRRLTDRAGQQHARVRAPRADVCIESSTCRKRGEPCISTDAAHLLCCAGAVYGFSWRQTERLLYPYSWMGFTAWSVGITLKATPSLPNFSLFLQSANQCRAFRNSAGLLKRAYATILPIIGASFHTASHITP